MLIYNLVLCSKAFSSFQFLLLRWSLLSFIKLHQNHMVDVVHNQADWRALRGALVGCLALLRRKSIGIVTNIDAKAVAKSYLQNLQVQSLAQHDRKVGGFRWAMLVLAHIMLEETFLWENFDCSIWNSLWVFSCWSTFNFFLQLCFELLECLLEHYPEAAASLVSLLVFLYLVSYFEVIGFCLFTCDCLQVGSGNMHIQEDHVMSWLLRTSGIYNIIVWKIVDDLIFCLGLKWYPYGCLWLFTNNVQNNHETHLRIWRLDAYTRKIWDLFMIDLDWNGIFMILNCNQVSIQF